MNSFRHLCLRVGILIALASTSIALGTESPKFQFDQLSSQAFGLTLKTNEHEAKLAELFKKIDDLKKSVIINNAWIGKLTDMDLLKLRFILNQIVEIKN